MVLQVYHYINLSNDQASYDVECKNEKGPGRDRSTADPVACSDRPPMAPFLCKPDVLRKQLLVAGLLCIYMRV